MTLDINVINIQASLDYILENHCSVACFGDGEMDIISGHSIPYQTYHPDLAQVLKEILATESSPDLLVYHVDVFEHFERYASFSQDFWKVHLEHNEDLYRKTATASWYGSSFISRPYMDLADQSQAGVSFKKIRQLWQDKDILIVEGDTSRSGIGNDLFDNSSSVSRVFCPSKNAYSRYDLILEAVKKHANGKLVLLMLGPTAKVLARDLSQEGIQAIDIGHIDSEYEWFKMGATTKVKLANKHTAEFNFDDNILFDNEEAFEEQVVSHIIDDREKVPVIVPVYNSQDYLDTCLDSIAR
ncbi:SP_1767 family glycosyltransferase [Streptococcus merionis]|uniref:SP_1767 family glycosyltransferase n=1 Tax=Streptococcus merionis TaxID=400065 RepID=UPI0026F0DB72|nr:SP_1767 family glycosyltransferase [Streptococcus merionis]